MIPPSSMSRPEYTRSRKTPSKRGLPSRKARSTVCPRRAIAVEKSVTPRGRTRRGRARPPLRGFGARRRRTSSDGSAHLELVRVLGDVSTVRPVPPRLLEGATAVWTGAELLVWGSEYDPETEEHPRNGFRVRPRLGSMARDPARSDPRTNLTRDRVVGNRDDRVGRGTSGRSLPTAPPTILGPIPGGSSHPPRSHLGRRPLAFGRAGR